MPRLVFKQVLVASALSLFWTCVLELPSLRADANEAFPKYQIKTSDDKNLPKNIGSSQKSKDVDETIDHYENVPANDRADYAGFNKDNDRIPWTFLLVANAGYNQLLKGYKGYSNLGNAGIDLYMKPGRLHEEMPGWKEHLAFRLSADYFPLQVPKGVYGVTEDIYGISGSILVKAFTFSRAESDQWVPFFGVGVGHYMDRVTLNTPASGKVSGTHNHFGANGSLGVLTPTFFGRLQLIPEIRLHMLKIPDNSWAMNMTYQVGLAFRF